MRKPLSLSHLRKLLTAKNLSSTDLRLSLNEAMIDF